MPAANQPLIDDYNALAKFLHWSVALLIIINYILGLTIASTSLYTLHKQTGLTILLLVMLRIIWRLSSRSPGSLAGISQPEDRAAKGGQLLLYILMLAIPLSGAVLVQTHGYPLPLWGIVNLPNLFSLQPHATTHLIKEFHLWLAHAIILIAAVHALIAIYHHLFRGNRLLLRMLPGIKQQTSKPTNFH